jgi:hypothetical protein
MRFELQTALATILENYAVSLFTDDLSLEERINKKNQSRTHPSSHIAYEKQWTANLACNAEAKRAVLGEAHQFFHILKSLVMREDFANQDAFENEVRFFLKLRWLVVHHTPACYFNFSNSPINQACIGIAMRIAKNKESFIKIIAFTLDENKYYATRDGNLAEVTQEKGRLINLHSCIPDTNLTGIHFTAEVFSGREQNSPDHYFSSYVDDDGRPVDLSENDKMLLRHAVPRENAQASSCSEDLYYYCIIRYGEIPRAKGTLAYALYHLQQGLFKGSMSNQEAVLNEDVEELRAGTAADTAVRQFAEVWRRLTAEQKAVIDTLAPPENWRALGPVLRRVLMDQGVLSEEEFELARAENTFHCADLLQKNITANLAANKTPLLEIRYAQPNETIANLSTKKINDANTTREKNLLKLIEKALKAGKQRVFPFISISDFTARCRLYNIQSNSNELILSAVEWEHLLSIPEVKMHIVNAFQSCPNPLTRPLFNAFMNSKLIGAEPVVIFSLLCLQGDRAEMVQLLQQISAEKWDNIFPTTQDFLRFFEEQLRIEEENYDNLETLLLAIPTRFYETAFQTPQDYLRFNAAWTPEQQNFIRAVLSQKRQALFPLDESDPHLVPQTKIPYVDIKKHPHTSDLIHLNLAFFNNPENLRELFQNLCLDLFWSEQVESLLFQVFPNLDDFMIFFNSLNRLTQGWLLQLAAAGISSHYLTNNVSLRNFLTGLPPYFAQDAGFCLVILPQLLEVAIAKGFDHYLSLYTALDHTLLPAQEHIVYNLAQAISKLSPASNALILKSSQLPAAEKATLFSLFIQQHDLKDFSELMNLLDRAQQRELLSKPAIQIELVEKLCQNINDVIKFTDAFFDLPETVNILTLLFRGAKAGDVALFIKTFKRQYHDSQKQRFDIINSAYLLDTLSIDWTSVDLMRFLDAYPAPRWEGLYKAYNLRPKWDHGLEVCRDSASILEQHINAFSAQQKIHFIRFFLEFAHKCHRLSIKDLIVMIRHCEKPDELEDVILKVQRWDKYFPMTVNDTIIVADQLVKQGASPLPFDRDIFMKLLFQNLITPDTFVQIASSSKLSQKLRLELIPLLSHPLFSMIALAPPRFDVLWKKLVAITEPFSKKTNGNKEMPFPIAVLQLFPSEIMDKLAPLLTQQAKEMIQEFIQNASLTMPENLKVLLDPTKPSYEPLPLGMKSDTIWSPTATRKTSLNDYGKRKHEELDDDDGKNSIAPYKIFSSRNGGAY